MEDNLRTYKVGMNGEMMPMVNVWMTADEYTTWLIRKNDNDVVEPTESSRPATHNGSPHVGHAKPHHPSKYRKNTSRLSKERMNQFLRAYEQHDGDATKVAEEMNITRGSVSSYKSLAVNSGLMQRDDRRKGSRGKSANNNLISDQRAKMTAEYYQLFGGDLKRVGQAMGIRSASAKAYLSVARQRGLLEEA